MQLLFTFISLLSLTSCVTHIDYLGNSYPATTVAQVYLAESAIKQPYAIIGKGFIRYGSNFSPRSIEKIQKKIVAKAKQKGADGVVIQDYYVSDTHINTLSQMDSMGNGAVARSNTTVYPSIAPGFTILFVKYQ